MIIIFLLCHCVIILSFIVCISCRCTVELFLYDLTPDAPLKRSIMYGFLHVRQQCIWSRDAVDLLWPGTTRFVPTVAYSANQSFENERDIIHQYVVCQSSSYTVLAGLLDLDSYTDRKSDTRDRY